MKKMINRLTVFACLIMAGHAIAQTPATPTWPLAPIPDLKAMAEASPEKMEIRMALGNAYVRAKEYDLALIVFEKVLSQVDSQDKRAADIYLRIGETYRRKGDQFAALIAFRNAAKISPDNVVVVASLALSLETNGLHAEALYLLRHLRQ